MIFIEKIRLAGGETHEHIADVQWRNPGNNEIGTSSKQAVIDWLRQGGQALVTDGSRVVEVRVVEATPAYIQTWADGVLTNNLLALPRF